MMLERIKCILIFISYHALLMGQSEDISLKITHLTGDFFVYTTYGKYKGEKVPANGMYLLTNEGALLVDSPWDTTQFQPLLYSINRRHHQKVILCIATHFHEDRSAGLEYYRQQGIKTYTTVLTDEWSKKRGMKRAEYLMQQDTAFKIGQYSFETYFPGPGHSPDNIVLWFKNEKVLYGGCLIKSADDTSLGNLSDASIQEYSNTLSNVKKKCGAAQYIIPGHNDWTDNNSLKHSLKMAKKLNK